MPSVVDFRNKPWTNTFFLFVCSICFVVSTVYIEYWYDQPHFDDAFLLYSLSFLFFVILWKYSNNITWLLVCGILARVILIFVFPGFSDDIYRFYWDGRLIVSGISPYGILPEEVLSKNITYLDASLFDKLNSPYYYTIYPPINQLFFAIGAAFGGLIHAATVMKISVGIVELIGLHFIFKLLKDQKIPSKYAMLYYLNPLVILEGMGNLHFEIVMIAFLAIALFYIFQNKIILGTLFFALSIGTKLLPLMLLPYFYFQLKGKNRILFFGSIIFFLTMIFIPLLASISPSTFLNSVDLYFRKFEFNASFYYVLRFLGHKIFGYNLIAYVGPLLAISTISINIWLAKKSDTFSFQHCMFYSVLVWTTYLIFATTIHPWYVISLLFFSIFTTFKYPIVWSFLIFVSYASYSSQPYEENLWWVSLEYVLLLIFIWYELKSKILIK